MPAALKFPNLSILHPHKPYKFLHNIFSSSATTTSAATSVHSRIFLRLNHSGAWWRMTTPYPPATHNRVTQSILRGPKSHFSTSSDPGNKGQEAQSHRNLNAITGSSGMRATANGKLDNLSDFANTEKLLTLPTILTIGRVAAVPLLVSTFYMESWWGPTATTGIFVAAAITDWLDGYLARKMNLGTQFGAFLDPVADKLMVAATLILLCTKPFDAGVFGQAPWLLTVPAIAIIGREITMSAVREWAASKDRKLLEAVAVNNLGKWKTATQMTALTILLASRDSSFPLAGGLVSSGVVLVYISAWLALWSLIVYMRKISKVLLR